MEENQIVKALERISLQNKTGSGDLLTLNKFILKCEIFVDTKYHQSSLGIEILNHCKQLYAKHKETCKGINDCFCQRYKTDTFDSQYSHYINILTQTSNTAKDFKLKDIFPLLFDFIEYILLKEFKANKHSLNPEYFLICVTFYSAIVQNNSKSFYFLEEYINAISHRKISFVLKVQIELIKKNLRTIIKKQYSYLSIHNNQLFSSHLKVKNIMNFILIENYIKKAFQTTYNFLVTLPLKEISNADLLSEFMTYTNEMDKYHTTINNLVQCSNLYNNEKCTELQLTSKLSIYYFYFYGKLPDFYFHSFKLISAFDEFISYDTTKQLILSLAKDKHSTSHLQIEYLSDSLYTTLGYDNKNDALKIKKLSDIISFESYATQYEEYIQNKILKNYYSFHIPYMILTEKKAHYVQIYSLEGVIMITGTKLFIYCKLSEQAKSSCFTLINEYGVILGVSERFSKKFFMTPRILRQYPINLFHDLLHFNYQEGTKNQIVIDLVSIYENLCSLNSNLMFENNQDEYGRIYQLAREAITNIKGKVPEGDEVQYNIHIKLTPCNLYQDSPVLLLTYFICEKKFLRQSPYSLKKNINKNRTISKSREEEVHTIEEAPRNRRIYTMSKSPRDINSKLDLIMEQSLVVLHIFYRIKMRIINEFCQINKTANKVTDKKEIKHIFHKKVN